MRREGDSILFDDENQRRRFEEVVSVGDDVDTLLVSVLQKVSLLKLRAKQWWATAGELCEKDEQPVYHYDSQTLAIEKISPKPVTNTDPKTAFDWLQDAKYAAVAVQNFDMAAEIRELHDRWKKQIEFVVVSDTPEESE